TKKRNGMISKASNITLVPPRWMCWPTWPHFLRTIQGPSNCFSNPEERAKTPRPPCRAPDELPQAHHARGVGEQCRADHHSFAEPAKVSKSGVGGDAIPADQRRAKSAAHAHRRHDLAGLALSPAHLAGSGLGAAGHPLQRLRRLRPIESDRRDPP